MKWCSELSKLGSVCSKLDSSKDCKVFCSLSGLFFFSMGFRSDIMAMLLSRYHDVSSCFRHNSTLNSNGLQPDPSRDMACFCTDAVSVQYCANGDERRTVLECIFQTNFPSQLAQCSALIRAGAVIVTVSARGKASTLLFLPKRRGGGGQGMGDGGSSR